MTFTAGFPVYGQAKGGASGKQGEVGVKTNAGTPSATVADPESLPLDTGTAQGASGTAQGASGTQSVPVPIVSVWDFVRMLLVLALVVATIYLVFHLLKKRVGRKHSENDLIRVLGSRNLTGTRAMHLVEVGKSVYLVGSTDGGVELISQITDQESLDMVRLQAAEEPAARRRSFQEVLSDILKPTKKPPSMNDSVRFLKSQRERLKKL